VAFVIRQSPLNVQFFKADLLQVRAELLKSAGLHGTTWIASYRRALLLLLAPAVVTVRVLAFPMLEYTFTNERERGAAIGVPLAAFVLVVTLMARRTGLRLSRELD